MVFSPHRRRVEQSTGRHQKPWYRFRLHGAYSKLVDTAIGTNPERFEETVEGFERFLGDAEPTVYEHETFGARIASFEDSPAAIAEPLDADSWLSERVNAHDTLLPCAFLVEATDIETVKQQFELDGETPWENETIHWFDVDVGGRFGAIDRS